MHWFLWLQFFPASLENNFWHFKLTEAVCVGSLVTSAWLNLGNSVLFLSLMFLLLLKLLIMLSYGVFESRILPRQSHPSLKPFSAHFEYVGGGVSLPLIRSFRHSPSNWPLSFIIHVQVNMSIHLASVFISFISAAPILLLRKDASAVRFGSDYPYEQNHWQKSFVKGMSVTNLDCHAEGVFKFGDR